MTKKTKESEIHSLKTTLGIAESKIETLKEQVPAPTSPIAESTKETIRYILSFFVALAVTWVYGKYPILGDLQPDQSVVVLFTVTVLVRAIDKGWYHFQKNRGDVSKGVGLDRPVMALGRLFDKKKEEKPSGK